MISIKGEKELETLRRGREIMQVIMTEISEFIRPGVLTLGIEQRVEKLCQQHKVKPAFKGYQGFPYCICASPNDVVVHGFPGKTPLVEGDIVSIDFGFIIQSLYLDNAYTFPVGVISDELRLLLTVAKRACKAGISEARAGRKVQDISKAVESVIAPYGFGIVREYVGHGIGTQLHEDPQIPNYDTGQGGATLAAGMTLAIEPMVNLGSEKVYVASDKWAVKTTDGKPSAHFEHTIAITEKDPEILTYWPEHEGD
jgi:methionyl aminopeptidase